MPLDAPKHGDGGNLVYEWHGKLPAPTRTWSCLIEKMKEYEEKGLLEYTSTGTPNLKKYLDEMPGAPLLISPKPLGSQEEYPSKYFVLRNPLRY